VLLDLPPEVGLARARGRAVADRLESESLDFHQRVRKTFIALAEAEPDRYLVLDARRSPDDIAAQIRERVGDLLAGLPVQTLAKAPVGHREHGGHRKEAADRTGAGDRTDGAARAVRPSPAHTRELHP